MKKSLDEQIEIVKLKLALLKENRFYRETYYKLKADLGKPVKDWSYPVELVLTTKSPNKEYCEKHPNLTLAYYIFYCVTSCFPAEIPDFAHAFRFHSNASVKFRDLSENELSILFDPKKDVNQMSQEMTNALLSLFNPLAVKGVMRNHPRVQNCFTDATKEDVNNATSADTVCDGLDNECFTETGNGEVLDQQSYERLVMINMRKTKKQIMDEIAHFVDRTHELSKVHANSHDTSYRNYTKWQTDNAKHRKEAWVQLEIWKLWKQGKGYKQIARELDLTRDVTAKAFHRAYERIYNTPYDRVDVLENEKSQIEKPDLDQFHKDCPNKPCQTCKKLCPEFLELVEMFISQDKVPQREKCETDMNLPEDCEDPLGYLNNKYKEVILS